MVCKDSERYAGPLSIISLYGTPRFNTADLSTPSISSAVSPRQKALCVIRRDESSISDTKYVFRMPDGV